MSLGPPYERRGTLSSNNTLQASPGVLRTIHSPTVPSRAFAVGRSYWRIRTRTAPRVILRSWGWPYRRTLGHHLVFEPPLHISERRGNNLKGFKDLYLKATAGIWP